MLGGVVIVLGEILRRAGGGFGQEAIDSIGYIPMSMSSSISGE
jgi:hypothetical protein